MKAENRIRLRYVVVDLLSTALAVFVFNIFRYFQLPKAFTGFRSLGQFLCSHTVVAGQVLFPLAMLLVYYLSGTYSRIYLRSRVSELLTTLSTAVIGTLAIIFVALINDLTLERDHDYPLFLVAFGLLFAMVYVPRLIQTTHIHHLISRGTVSFNALIIGAGARASRIEKQLESGLAKMGIHAVGVVDSDIDSVAAEVEALAGNMRIERLIIVPDDANWQRTVELVNALVPLDLPILIPAESLPPMMFSSTIMDIKSDTYIDISASRHRASTMNIKRALDVVVSLVVLVVTFVPGLLVALAVKLDSRGPVFYTQQRVGRHKKLFTIYKLRTMHTDSEADGVARLSSAGDPRVTRIGHFLRRYRLDEFPQFFNVLRGDMSLVGPRPERMPFVEEILRREPSYTFVFSVRPGITSLGMVKFGYASTMEQIMRRTRYDLLYVEHLSIINDLKIVLHTVNTVISGKGV